MKPNLKQQLICQQIDIVIIGSKTFQLLEVLLNKNLNLVPLPKLKSKYLSSLSNLYNPPYCHLLPQQPLNFPSNIPYTPLQKYTTNLLTQSFWLQFNFYYFGALSFDPLLASLTRGKISICIVVFSQSESTSFNQGDFDGELKRMLMRDGGMGSIHSIYRADDRGRDTREEVIMEHRIINCLHAFKLNQFSSVLMLNMIDKNRIIQGTSNIKLSRNQILRWIVDRYFQNQFGIKLRGQVGDQIENHREVQAESYCQIM